MATADAEGEFPTRSHSRSHPTGGGISQMAGESLRENPRGSYTSSRFHQQISGTCHGNSLYLYYESKSKHLVSLDGNQSTALQNNSSEVD